MKRHKKHEDHEEHASEAWLVAFADMMTLLMVTFLMMFAISSLDLQKFKTFQQAVDQGLGSNTHSLASTGAPPEGEPKDVPIGAKEGTPNPKPSPIPESTGKTVQRKDLEDLKKKVEKAAAEAGLKGALDIEVDPRGLILYVTSGVLFDAGEAELTQRGDVLLARLGTVLEPIDNDLVVEGHTDRRPISTPQFPSNWELSTSRATAVLRHLIAEEGLRGGRLSAAGYADTRPRAKGETEAALSKNRRVDIVVEVPQPAPVAATPAAAPAAPAPEAPAVQVPAVEAPAVQAPAAPAGDGES